MSPRRLWAVAVVDGLELVEVDEQHDAGSADVGVVVPAGGVAVRQSGERSCSARKMASW
jgi:hypothetical protein